MAALSDANDKPLLGLPNQLSSQGFKHALTVSDVYVLNVVAILLGSLSI